MNELPQGWAYIRLADIVTPRKGKRPAVLRSFPAKDFVPYLDIQAIEKNEINAYAEVVSSRLGSREDIFVVWDGARSGWVGLGREGAIGSTIMALRLDVGYRCYVYRWFQSKFYYFNTNTRGTGIPHVDPDIFWDIEVPFAPIREQKRIARKLKAIFTKVETSQKRLEKIPVILKRFRQSVLAAACSGRLTADWRERNPNFADMDTILDAIKNEREGKAATTVQKDKLRKMFSLSEEGDLGELPETWRYVFLNKLCDSFDYGTSAKSKPSGRIPVLRMGNIQNGEIDWKDLVYTSDEEEIKRYCLRPNTALFNRTNSPELVGKTAIYRGERPAIFAGYLIRVNQCPELDPEYLNICLNTTYAKAFWHRVKTDGVSQSNINAQKLGFFEVPFCSLIEQQEIVRRVQALFKLADQIGTRYAKAKAQVDKLTQSILAKAFRGELVPQDPNDEPASVLLERIRARRKR